MNAHRIDWGLNPDLISLLRTSPLTFELGESKVLCQLSGYHLSNFRNLCTKRDTLGLATSNHPEKSLYNSHITMQFLLDKNNSMSHIFPSNIRDGFARTEISQFFYPVLLPLPVPSRLGGAVSFLLVEAKLSVS